MLLTSVPIESHAIAMLPMEGSDPGNLLQFPGGDPGEISRVINSAIAPHFC
ncbi:hypothetical protein J0895_06135 [Phormidium pseudopriestleyi FRX01]|uniref:Uncharacterized protein n=1 Tax=Phormidium pseudopriestleyi FRX01 TaxID=1759528 RepID=A0ABS3FNI5_9CYAN|nr:hypothetical protein [Phormidium pseudopriestleyi]MBO0348685.1 hypothetical protein [Phormidium pseudopriestleyi FRX01]